MEDDLHAGVRHELRQRGRVAHAVLHRVEHDDLVADADLHEAQERPVPALGHELGVDPEAPLVASARRQALDLSGQGRSLR